MGGSISVVMAGIFMCKLEKDVLKPPYPIFYKRYVDDTYVRKKKNHVDSLYNELNNYHENINFTVENNPDKFLDTKISFSGTQTITEVVSKENKLPAHWQSNIPKRYKRNIINGELHRAKKIATDFEKELVRIKVKFKNAGYPYRFVNSVISSFMNQNNNNVQDAADNIPKLLINLPFCPQNEKLAKSFINRLKCYTKSKYNFIITWKTRKIRTLFPLKDKVAISYSSDVIYRGVCSCAEDYIGETDRNSITRWNEHDDIRKSSEPAKHLKSNTGHHFEWTVMCRASKLKMKRKILESFLIKLQEPSLNKNIESFRLKLFQNGIT